MRSSGHWSGQTGGGQQPPRDPAPPPPHAAQGPVCVSDSRAGTSAQTGGAPGQTPGQAGHCAPSSQGLLRMEPSPVPHADREALAVYGAGRTPPAPKARARAPLCAIPHLPPPSCEVARGSLTVPSDPCACPRGGVSFPTPGKQLLTRSLGSSTRSRACHCTDVDTASSPNASGA